MFRPLKHLLPLAVFASALAAAPAQASTTTVTSTADSGAGSLRAAVAAATGSDTIVLPAGTYNLLTPVIVNKTLTIRGAGARSTILDGGNATRLLQLESPAGQVTIEGVTITHGKATSGDGGGIQSKVPLVIRDSALVGNVVTSGDGAGLSQTAVLTMERTLVAGNTATLSSGGGISLAPAGAPTSTITSSTIAQNAAYGTGGGIDVSNSSAQFLNINNSTLDANTLSSNSGQGGNFRAWSSTTVRLRNTWTGHGVATSGPNCYQAGSAYVITQGHNAQDVNDPECQFNAGIGDKINVAPLFTPLQDNGGPTDTYALLAGSPLIDAADGPTCATTDQRNVARPQGAGCDIGAVERTTAPTLGTPAAEAVTATGTTITAAVNTIGLGGTLRIDYGVSTAYGSSQQAAVAPAPGATTAGVPLSGLTPSTTYHYRATLTTPDGTATSADGTFTTAAPAPSTGGGGTGTGTGTGTGSGTGGGTPAASKCKVPKLKGLSLTRAKKALTKAHCRLGKVTKRKGRAGRGTLVVVAQSKKAGAVLASGARVGVTLGKKPKTKKHA